MDFEWNPHKDATNHRKHGVGFREAATIFGDPFALTFPDLDHSHSEQRSLTLRTTASGRLLVVIHTERGDAMRIVSARPATPRERKFYEEE